MSHAGSRNYQQVAAEDQFSAELAGSCARSAWPIVIVVDFFDVAVLYEQWVWIVNMDVDVAMDDGRMDMDGWIWVDGQMDGCWMME